MAMVFPDVTTVNQAKMTGLLGLAGWLFSSEFNNDETRLGYLQNRYPNLVSSRLNKAFSLTKSAYTAAQILSNTGSVKVSEVPRGAIAVPPGMRYSYDVSSVIDFDETLPGGGTRRRHFVDRAVLYSSSLLNANDLNALVVEHLENELSTDEHYGLSTDDIPPESSFIHFSAVTRT